MHSANLPDAEKSKNKEAELHLALANQERAIRNGKCVKAAEELKLNFVLPSWHMLVLIMHNKCSIFRVHSNWNHYTFSASQMPKFWSMQ